MWILGFQDNGKVLSGGGRIAGQNQEAQKHLRGHLKRV
jgi:hypothetical protein